MSGFWTWATEHWFLAFLLMVLIIQSVTSIISRTYRLIMVTVRGWPKHSPIMDADGDIVYPKKES